MRRVCGYEDVEGVVVVIFWGGRRVWKVFEELFCDYEVIWEGFCIYGVFGWMIGL